MNRTQTMHLSLCRFSLHHLPHHRNHRLSLSLTLLPSAPRLFSNTSRITTNVKTPSTNTPSGISSQSAVSTVSLYIGAPVTGALTKTVKSPNPPLHDSDDGGHNLVRQQSSLSVGQLSRESVRNALTTSQAPSHLFKIGSRVQAVVIKTHLLGVLMSIVPSVQSGDDNNNNNNSGLARTTSSNSSVSTTGAIGTYSSSLTRFVGLMPHLEVEIYRKAVGRDIRLDEEYEVFIQRVTSDGKIELSFRPALRDRIQLGSSVILEALRGTRYGRIPVGEDSSPKDISHLFFGLSKSNFKKALGTLYKDFYIENPSGKLFTQLNSEETRLQLLRKKEETEAETLREVTLPVSIYVKNLPSSIKQEAVTQHVMQRIKQFLSKPALHGNNRKQGTGEGASTQSAGANTQSAGASTQSAVVHLKDVNISIIKMNIRSSNKFGKAMALIDFEVNCTSSTLGYLQKSYCDSAAEGSGTDTRRVAVMELLVHILGGLEIGKKLTIQKASTTLRREKKAVLKA